MQLIGIDIGMKGAIAAINGETERPFPVVYDMPIVEDDLGKRVDARALVKLLKIITAQDSEAHVLIENIIARPGGNRPGQERHGNTIQSQGSMMRQRGAIEAIVDCLGFPLYKVDPQAWKRRYGLIGKQKEDSRQTALRIFHGDPITLFLARKKDDGRAEALLLARHLLGMDR